MFSVEKDFLYVSEIRPMNSKYVHCYASRQVPKYRIYVQYIGTHNHALLTKVCTVEIEFNKLFV